MKATTRHTSNWYVGYMIPQSLSTRLAYMTIEAYTYSAACVFYLLQSLQWYMLGRRAAGNLQMVDCQDVEWMNIPNSRCWSHSSPDLGL